MSWLPSVVQGFTTRVGGESAPPYESLNLGLECGDDPAIVEANRLKLAQALNISPQQMVFAQQVHGDRVAVVDEPQREPAGEADALITNTPGLILTLFFADCYPVYFVDPIRKVAALAHAGWRGTALNIVGKTTEAMKRQFEVDPRACQVAIGPGIAGESYEVSSDVADRFRESPVSGLATPVMPRSEIGGKWELHLRQILFAQLLAAGYKAESIAVSEQDTFRNDRDFFSHRRESLAGKKTGRMAGFLGFGNSA